MILFGFGRKAPTAEQQLLSGRWKCGKCDEEHGWPFDLAACKPDPWPHGEEYEHNGALRMEGDFLSEDFCVLDGKYFMIRCVLRIPVIGVQGEFGFGCWSTLSRENFDKYVDGFDSGEYSDMGPWSGWLMNRLEKFTPGPDPLALWVQPRPDRQRPLLWVQDDDHPLAIAQEQGITPERMLEVFRVYGHGPK
jgi:hypothetical protein